MVRRCVWGVVFLVLLLPVVRAEWEEFSKPVYLDVSGENYKGTDRLEVENFFLKLEALDYESRVAQVTISDREGLVYYSGLISETLDFLQPGKIWVRWGDLRLYNGHPQVRFKVFLWQELSLVFYNIPKIMNWEDEYNVFMDWRSLSDAELSVFFKMVTQGDFLTPLQLDQNFVFKPGEQKRVYFRLRPERYVTTGPLTATRQELEDLSLELWVYNAGSGELLRRVNLGKYSLTQGPAAAIEEIVTPLTQFVGKEYEVLVRVRNSGFPQKNTGDLLKDSFVVRLEAAGFKVKDSDAKYVRMDPLTTQEVKFVITPLSGGVRSIVATFNADRKVAAALAERIVVKGAKTLLLGDLSQIPRDFDVGSSYKIPVKVLNRGDFTEEVVVRLSSLSFKVRSPEFVLRLPPKSDQEVVFDTITEKEGAAKLLFEVITSSPNFRVTQYFKGEGIAADEKEVSVFVKGLGGEVPKEEEPIKPEVTPPSPVTEETPIEEEPQEAVEPEIVIQPEPPALESKAPSFSLVNMLLLIVGIIIVFILVAFIVQKASKSGRKRKKKKVEGDFELE